MDDAYAELHCHSNFSFLDGASHPEELAEEAARLGLAALAITDHDGFYGVVRFAEAARPLALPTVFGAELTLGARDTPIRPSNGQGDQRGAARGGERRAAHVDRAPGRRGARSRAPRRQHRITGQRPLVRAHGLPQGKRAGRAPT